MGEDGNKRFDFREIGPPWIAAVGTLLGALATAGVFTVRANVTQAAASPAPTVTVTVTTVETVPSGETSQTPLAGDPSVYFSGVLTWGEFNLDQREPKTVGYRFIGSNTYDGSLTVNDPDQSRLAIWTTDSVPTKDQCAKFVATEGDTSAQNLVPGNRVCGQTTEGRIFRIEILGVGDSGIRTKTTVWNK